MHSSTLRGTDFQVTWRGRALTLGEFLTDWSRTDRLGVLARDGVEGAGAATLLLACVTRFYDDYRAQGDNFFAYPDYFTFQRRTPPANFGMLDVWPEHKSVSVGPTASETAAAVADRAVNLLMLPADGVLGVGACEPVDLAALRRCVARCFVYDRLGSVPDADLIVECGHPDLAGWVCHMLASVSDADEIELGRWQQLADSGAPVRQSFRALDPGRLWARLGNLQPGNETT